MRSRLLPTFRTTRPGHPYFAGAPLLIAHRGGSALAPENTLLAFDRALRWWGADILEIDVQPTRDAHAVVIHDSQLDRTTDASGAVAERTLAELRVVDAGFRFSPDGGRSFPFRGRGIGISTLAEVLDAFPAARVNVEIKAAAAQPAVLAAIRAARAERRVLIAASRPEDREGAREFSGPVSASSREFAWFYLWHRLGLAGLHRPSVDAFQMPDRHHGRPLPTPRLVCDAHRWNVPVHVWTVDDPERMRELLAWGVDGVITDRPDRLARLLHERGLRPPPPGPAPGEAEEFLAGYTDT